MKYKKSSIGFVIFGFIVTMLGFVIFGVKTEVFGVGCMIVGFGSLITHYLIEIKEQLENRKE
jgi:hypothetical protein